jgi:hypothetical protein
MFSQTPLAGATRRVVLLETDERAGLVAALAAVCAAQNVSLDIVTGPGHVLITFDTEEATLEALLPKLQAVGGVVTPSSAL